ncbi:chitin deacetylase 8-like [Epargyreus clarus]|uniref:chitin deacetylase 8-like n=1 Tax=Epargyreus clarus TaxID=520877 RepID=UPI003C2F5B3B
MKLITLILAIAVAFVVADEEELPLAEACDPEVCKLPDCRCSLTGIPGDLLPRNTPQFVLLTFDDGVNIQNIETYRATIFHRKNKNECPIGVTFFVSHEYTNYQIVNELYNQGFEIALHSITHQIPQTYWAEADYEVMMREFGDQKTQMSHFANIPSDALKGVRMPFLQMSGNASFQMMASADLTYDLTWPTTRYQDPGLWPYTLDYASSQDCITPPCPSASIPGPWVLPIITWSDLEGRACSFVDACFSRPDLNDEEGWFRFFVTNFERHYFGNRSPFGFYVHEWFISWNPAVRRAFVRFMDLLNNLHDVFMVNANEVIDWVKDPIPLDEYKRKPCRQIPRAQCAARSCGPLTSSHTEMSYWMQICNVCPRVYPWLGNPLGQ